MSPIVVDSSAILAILRDEPEKDAFLEMILAAHPRLMSAVNVQELGMVVAGHTGDERTWLPLNELLKRLQIKIVAHDAMLARAAATMPPSLRSIARIAPSYACWASQTSFALSAKATRS